MKKSKPPVKMQDGRGARSVSEARIEKLYAPIATGPWLGIGAAAIGALAAGAGTYGQFLRGAGPHPWSVGLLVGGAALLAVGFLSGSRESQVVLLGDDGVAVQRGEVTERLGWYEVDAIRFAQGILSFTGGGKVISIPVATLGRAASEALGEARRRIPEKAESLSEVTLTEIAGPEPVAHNPEPLQVAGLRCGATGKILNFEKDVRLCRRCGQPYHRAELPDVCRCGAPLR